MSDRELRARIVIEGARALGLDLADLIAAAGSAAVGAMTVAEHLVAIEPTFNPRTAATYRSYWRLTTEHLGARRLGDVTLAELIAVVDAAAARAIRNRPTSTGRSSRETCIAALRAMFDRAVVDGLVRTNPAARLVKPRRARSRRRALNDRELGELIAAVRATSRDPDLDLLLIRFHLESGARRDGALNLRRHDIDESRASVWLHEKFDTEREQPVSPSLIRLLRHHTTRRGSDRRDAPVFHTANGKPLTTRHYDRLFELARHCLPWAERTPVSAHVLRHTAINAVGRLAGEPVANRFAGHTPSSITGRYLHASIEEVAEAVAELTDEPHPLTNTGNGNGAPNALRFRSTRVRTRHSIIAPHDRRVPPTLVTACHP